MEKIWIKTAYYLLSIIITLAVMAICISFRDDLLVGGTLFTGFILGVVGHYIDVKMEGQK